MRKIETFFPDVKTPGEVARVFRELADMLELGRLQVERGAIHLQAVEDTKAGTRKLSLGAQLHFSSKDT